MAEQAMQTKTYIKMSVEGIAGAYYFRYDYDTHHQQVNEVLERIKATGYPQDGVVRLEAIEMTDTEYQAISATYPEWPGDLDDPA